MSEGPFPCPEPWGVADGQDLPEKNSAESRVPRAVTRLRDVDAASRSLGDRLNRSPDVLY
jgi:hypothetical protein